MKVFKKYDGNLPLVLSNQKFNEYIKLVGREAGLTNPVPVSKTKGGLRVDTTAEKCDLITSHTCRRSFASNAYMADIPTLSIMKITGHKTERAFLNYIRITPEENAEKLRMHAFFSPKMEVVKQSMISYHISIRPEPI